MVSNFLIFYTYFEVPAPTAIPEVKGNCPGKGWIEYGASCFLFRPDHFYTWKQAKQVNIQSISSNMIVKMFVFEVIVPEGSSDVLLRLCHFRAVKMNCAYQNLSQL